MFLLCKITFLARLSQCSYRHIFKKPLPAAVPTNVSFMHAEIFSSDLKNQIIEK